MTKTEKIISAVLAAIILALSAASFFLWRGAHALRQEAAERIAQLSSAEQNNGSVSGALVISEVMSDNRATVRDRDGNFSDWIEIFNPSSQTVDLKNWSLSDSLQGSAWIFPKVTVGPGEYILVFASDRVRTGDELHAGFTLDGSETIFLREPSGRVSDIAVCSDFGSDCSGIRSDSGALIRCVCPTPGRSNSPEGLELFQQNRTTPGPLVISEAAFSDGVGWIELKNTAAWTVDASDYFLSFSAADDRFWHLPGLSVESGKCLLILCDGEDFTDNYTGIVHAPFTLGRDNCQLFLFGPNGLTDYLGLGGIPAGCSLGRVDEENGFWFFETPTPGSDNSRGLRRVSSAPVAVARDGIFTEEESPILELSGCGTIRYTTDGAAPTESSAEYTGPVSLDSSCVVRAACFEADAVSSESIALTYVISDGSSLPVVSVVADDVESFYDNYGRRNVSFEAAGSFSFFRDSSALSAPCGISLSAVSSLGADRKALLLSFRQFYGAESVSLSAFGAMNDYSSLLLRPAQGSDLDFIRNQLCRELAGNDGISLITLSSSPVTLFLNGENLGIYMLEETAEPRVIARAMGVSAESVETEPVPASTRSEFYYDVIKFAMFNDIGKEANYQQLAEAVDLDSLADLLIFQCACGISEPGSGSMLFARSPEGSGKWYGVLGDMDSAFYSQTGFDSLLGDYALSTVQISPLFSSLTANPQFREKLLTRCARLYSSVLSPSFILETVDSVSRLYIEELSCNVSCLGEKSHSFPLALENLRNTAGSGTYADTVISSLCRQLKVSPAERQRYFGTVK